jgi:hypothetical protein
MRTPDLGLMIALFTVVLLLVFGYHNRKQGWRRERYDFFEELQALEYAVYGDRAAATERTREEREADKSLRLLLTAVLKATPAALVHSVTYADIQDLEQQLGTLKSVTIAERGAALIAAHQQAIASQGNTAVSDLALRARALSETSQALALILRDVEFTGCDAETRLSIERAHACLAELPAALGAA